MTERKRWFRWPRRGARQIAEEVETEVEFHLAMAAAALERRGFAPAEARARARSRFGDVNETIQELRAMDERHEQRAAWRTWLRELGQDLRFGGRILRRRPAVTAASVLTLAVGIGGTLSILTVMEGVLFRPLDYPEPDRLVHVRGDGSARFAVTFPDYLAIREGSRTLERTAVWQGWRVVLEDPEGPPVRLPAALASAGFFEVLGARPAVGRLFTPGDAVAGHTPVVVLSHATWRERFGGRPDVVGEVLEVGDVAYTIVGVVEEGFVDPLAGRAQPALWQAEPPEFERAATDRGWVGFWVIGRMRPGATVAEVQREVNGILRAEYPTAEEGAVLARVVTFKEALVGSIRPTLYALLAAVVAVLLISCVNVANLLLSSGSARVRELAVRASIGASRARLVRQLLAESVVLACTGAVLGLAIAWAGSRFLVRLAGAQLPRAEVVGLNAEVVALAVALALLTGIVFGVAPALQLTGRGLAETLREGGRGEAGSRRAQRFQGALVVAEAALALMLVSSAGVLLRTLWNLGSIDPGFDAARVTTVRVGLPPEFFPTHEQQTLALQRVVAEVGAEPGVARVAAISDLPMSGNVNSTFIRRPGGPEDEGVQTLVRAITPDFHAALGIPLLRGRLIQEADRAGTAPVAVVNREFARRMFGGEEVLGAEVVVRGVRRRIVGVVEDVHEFTLTGPSDPVLYVPYAQELPPWMSEAMVLVVRAAGDPGSIVGSVRSAIREASPRIPVDQQRPLRELVERDISAPRLRAAVVLLFAGVALLLAAIGLTGVMGYSVSRRRSEIGVRLALGADAGRILRLVLRQSAALALVGVGVGLAGTWAATRLLAGFLYGVAPLDPLVLAACVLGLLAVLIAAGYLPARRAARLDPMVALRSE